jgi:hypothetical protein
MSDIQKHPLYPVIDMLDDAFFQIEHASFEVHDMKDKVALTHIFNVIATASNALESWMRVATG